MTQRSIIALGVVVLLLVVGVYLYTQGKGLETTNGAYTGNQTATSSSSGRAMTVEQYITANISSISPVKEALGGTFYVTNVETHGGAGTVYYEDGHSSYIADFTYDTDADTGAITVKTFTVR